MEESSVYPKVSIVTPSYNQGKFIERTILSVICQDYPNLEYIVVDAVSKDETKEVLDRYSEHIDVVIIESDTGQANALNKGFKLCTGEVLAYLNSDDCYAAADVISKVVAHFEQNPEMDVVYGQRNSMNEDGYFVYCQPYRPFSKENLYLSDYIPQECTFWRRSIFEKAGPYIDESFNFAMDYELWFRFLKHDAQFLSVEDFFGLFRTYQKQKSIDLWHTLGLPEIARLHRTYLDRYIPEKEMIDYYQEHSFQAHPETQPAAFSFAQHLWGCFTTFKRDLIAAPLDRWAVQEYKRKYASALSKS
jgi:glycosyltransferase involved in cell wall biosynthesis